MTNLNGYNLENDVSIKVSMAMLSPSDSRLISSSTAKDTKNMKDPRKGQMNKHINKPLVHFQLPSQGRYLGNKPGPKPLMQKQTHVNQAWMTNCYTNDTDFDQNSSDKKYHPVIGRGRGIIKESKPPGMKAVWLNGKESRFIEGENGELVLALGRGGWVLDHNG